MNYTVIPTQADIDAAEGLGCITEERQSIVEKAFARHRIAAYAAGEAAGIKLRDDYYEKVRKCQQS